MKPPAVCSKILYLEKVVSILLVAVLLWGEYQKSVAYLEVFTIDSVVNYSHGAATAYRHKAVTAELSYGFPQGFVLAAHFNDELTGSCSNLQSLQCLARKCSTGLKVVEPFFIKGSILGFPQIINLTKTRILPEYHKDEENHTSDSLDPHNYNLALSDVFDEDEWSRYGMEREYAPLVKWAYFLKNASRNLILLDRVCIEDEKSCMSCQNGYYNSKFFSAAANIFAMQNNFTIIRKSCYHWKRLYDLDEFLTLAYGSHKPEESILLINHFGGIQVNGDQFRIQIKNIPCSRNFEMMKTSSTISERTSNYQKKYIPNADSKGYISVMIRMQYVAIRLLARKHIKEKGILQAVQTCLTNTLKEVFKLKRTHEMTSVFLATDMGKYGSNYFRYNQFHLGISNANLKETMKLFYQKLFNDDHFTEANLTARIEDVMYPVFSFGYAALLEQNIASHGKCLVLVGDGEFQRNALKLHQKKGYKCVRNVPDCN